jgi:mRNA-degrading endonuclease toxin of MazEF toxin-antitoxin module
VSIGQRPVPTGPRRGDIHFLDFRDVGGAVIRGPYPAVVVQSDRMSRSSTVVLVPMTSAPRSADLWPPYLVPVSARESGLSKDGWVKVDQLLTYPTVALGPRAGRLSPERLTDVDQALRFVLGL